MKPITVLVADDEPQVSDVIAAVIATDDRLKLIGVVAEAEAAIRAASDVQPDVALVDVRMPGGGGVRAAREIVRRSPPTRVVALSAFEDAETILTMLRAGARYFVAKSDPTDQILAAIHRAAEEDPEPTREIERIVAAFDEWMDRRREQPDVDSHVKARIQRVLEADGLGAEFVPVLDLVSGQVVGVDAHPLVDGDEATTAVWGAAEKAGVLAQLELGLLRKALDEVDRLPPGRWVSVGVSQATGATAGFLDALSAAPRGGIVLRLPKPPIYQTSSEGWSTALAWRSAGIRIAIDDVGPGIESLRQMARIRPDFLRLDRSLIVGIGEDAARQRLIKALVAIASQLGIEAIATGVDDARSIEPLLQLGLQLGQGSALIEPGDLRGIGSPRKEDAWSPRPAPDLV